MALEFGSHGMAQSSMRGKSGTRGGSARTVVKILMLWTVFGSSVTNFHISPRQGRLHVGPWRREGKHTMQLIRTRATTTSSEDAAWKLLGLEPGASEEDVEKTYKQLVKKYHPDTKITGDVNMLQKIVKAKLIIMSSFKIGAGVEKRMSKPKSHRDPFVDDEEDFRDVDAELNYRADEIYFECWDREQKSYYYVNEATGASSWKRPRGRCYIRGDRDEKEKTERRIKGRMKYEGGHALREVFNRRLGQFAGLREMGFQEGANDITQAQCEGFCDWLEEKAEAKFWRLQMRRGTRVIGVIAYDKNITEAQCNEIVDLLLHHDSAKRDWRQQLVEYPFGFVRLCSLPVESLHHQNWTKAKIVQFMSMHNEHFAMPHELRSLMLKHAMDVEAEKKHNQRRREEKEGSAREEGSIASALRSRLNMSYGLRKIDEMAYEVPGATKLSQAEREAVCEILLQCAETPYTRKRLKRELKLHPYGAVKLFVTPAVRLRGICRSLKALVEFLRENRQPLGL